MAKKTFGIIGYPVKHSLSPAMQNAAFAELGIDAEYCLFEVPPQELERFLSEVRSKGISGLNVTIPHKIKAKEFIERTGMLDDTARKLGAVNTVKVSDDGSLVGHNTDGPGFYRSLVEELRFEPEGRSICVLGAGGAAKAVVMYLGSAPRKISVYDIDGAKCAGLAAHYTAFFNSSKIEIVSGEGALKAAVAGSDLLINATPIGMKETDPSPVRKEYLRAGLYVYDLVYNRPYTQLVRDANAAKAHAVTGLGMLLYQGAIAFEIWTGKKAPVAVMRTALKEAIRKG